MGYYTRNGKYIHNIANEQANLKYRLIDNVAYEKGLLEGAALMANAIARILTIEKVI